MAPYRRGVPVERQTSLQCRLYLDEVAYFEFGSIKDALVNYPQADEVAALPYQYTIK